jgi:predicted alpha/beta-fold hydrolase
MTAAAKEMISETGGGVRLLGSYSPQTTKQPKGLVIFLHGWEGSIDSTYIVRIGGYLHQKGYAIFRLNFRDHGDSHHLNPGLFYATLLDEVHQTVKQVAENLLQCPAFLVGFSLGGNFALRIARKVSKDPIRNIKHIISISPVLDPQKATERIESIYYIHRYFLKKWHRSLKKKQALFPDLYDFSEIFKINSIRKITDVLIEKYSNLTSSDDYFKGYTLSGEDLKHTAIPVTLIIAADDPIIPIEDFYKLQLNGDINLTIQNYGGHNGFITGISLERWYEGELVALFDDIVCNQKND